VLALEIIEDLQASLEEFELIGADLARVSDHSRRPIPPRSVAMSRDFFAACAVPVGRIETQVPIESAPDAVAAALEAQWAMLTE
jgi:hypothetical protein